MAEEAETAAGRVWEVFDTDPLIADQPGARTLGAGRRRGPLRRRALRLPRRASGRSCAASTSRSTPARRSRSSARPAPARRPSPRCSSRLQDPTHRLGARSTATTCATSRCAACAAQVGFAFEEPTLFSASVRENLLIGHPDATDADIETRARDRAGGVRVRPAVGTRHPHRRAGPLALGRSAPAARAGARDRRPPARARARRPAVRARRAHRSARRRSACARSWPTAPRSSWCTGRRRSRSRTAPRSSTTAASSRPASHRDLLASRAALRRHPQPGRRGPRGADERADRTIETRDDRARRDSRRRRSTVRSTSPATRTSTRGAASRPKRSRNRAPGSRGCCARRSRRCSWRP